MKQAVFSGEDLRAQRELRDLSVEDVYRMLRVPTACIRAFEAGDTASLPAMTYAAGFLKSYCLFLDLDPDPYLDALHQSEAPPQGFLRITYWKDNRKTAWLADTITWAAICAILALGWFTYSVVVQPGATPDTAAVQADTLDLHVPDAPDLP